MGIIAVNVIGDIAPTGSAPSTDHMHIGAAAPSHGPAGKKDSMSPMDDITFDLNFDPSTAKQIRYVHVNLCICFFFVCMYASTYIYIHTYKPW